MTSTLHKDIYRIGTLLAFVFTLLFSEKRVSGINMVATNPNFCKSHDSKQLHKAKLNIMPDILHTKHFVFMNKRGGKWGVILYDKKEQWSPTKRAKGRIKS